MFQLKLQSCMSAFVRATFDLENDGRLIVLLNTASVNDIVTNACITAKTPVSQQAHNAHDRNSVCSRSPFVFALIQV